MLGAQEPSEKMTEHSPRTTGAGVTPGSGGAGTEGTCFCAGRVSLPRQVEPWCL